MRDITGVDLVKLTQAAYVLSIPLGLGHLHYRPEPLSDAEARDWVSNWAHDKQIALSLDYVNGRAVKLTVFRKEGRLEMRDEWYDHTPEQLQTLLLEVGATGGGE